MNVIGIPRNLHPHRDAEVTVFLPGEGLFRVACGSGDNLTEEDCQLLDDNKNRIDNYVMIYTYTVPPIDGVWERHTCGHGCMRTNGLLFAETDGGQMMYSSKTFTRGDIRDMLVPALEFMGWPTDLELYHLVGTSGEFTPKPRSDR